MVIGITMVVVMIEKKHEGTFWGNENVDLGGGHRGDHICKKSLN